MRSKLQAKELAEHRAYLDQQRAEKEAMLVMMQQQARLEAERQEEDIKRFQLEVHPAPPYAAILFACRRRHAVARGRCARPHSPGFYYLYFSGKERYYTAISMGL